MCLFKEENEFNQEFCGLDGKRCDGRCDGAIPSEEDVENGWFDDLKEENRWYWKHKKCPKCGSNKVKRSKTDYNGGSIEVFKCFECNYVEEFE